MIQIFRVCLDARTKHLRAIGAEAEWEVDDLEAAWVAAKYHTRQSVWPNLLMICGIPGHKRFTLIDNRIFTREQKIALRGFDIAAGFVGNYLVEGQPLPTMPHPTIPSSSLSPFWISVSSAMSSAMICFGGTCSTSSCTTSL